MQVQMLGWDREPGDAGPLAQGPLSEHLAGALARPCPSSSAPPGVQLLRPLPRFSSTQQPRLPIAPSGAVSLRPPFPPVAQKGHLGLKSE